MKLDGRSLLPLINKHRLSVSLALSVAIGLLAVHLLWLDPILDKKHELADKIAQQRQMIQKYQEKLAQSKDLKETLSSQEGELSRMQRRVFHGADSYQLAAELGDLVSAKGSQDLNVKSYQVLASKEYGAYQEVQIKFDFTANIVGLQIFLNGLQKSATAIQVQQLRVQKIQRKTGHDLVISTVLTALMETSRKP